MSHTKLSMGLGLIALLGFSSVAQAVDYQISGQVNRMIRFADDDVESDMQHLDNSANESRLNLSAGGEFAGMRAEVFTELRLDSNASQNVGLYDDEDSRHGAKLEYADIRITADWGTVSMGRGDGAARFAQRQDLSGTDLADNFDFRRIAGLEFRTDLGSPPGYYGDHAIGWFEGSRNDRIRYDSPSFGGSVASISFGEGRSYELGLTFDSALEAASSSAAGTSSEAASSGFDGLRIIAAIGYTDTGESRDLDISNNSHCHYCVEDAIAASVSAIIANGFGLTVGYGSASMTNDTHGIPGVTEFKDIDGMYIKPFLRSGNHAYSLSFGTNSDIDATVDPMGFDGYDGGHWALSYQYNGESGVDVYASYQKLEMEGNGTLVDLEDIKVLFGGVRLTF